MKTITIRDQIKEVPERWRRQYIAGVGQKQKDKLEIYVNLLGLNTETCTAEEIAVIIGNDSWAKKSICKECGKGCYTVVQVGEEMDYESATTWLCLSCVKMALFLLKGIK